MRATLLLVLLLVAACGPSMRAESASNVVLAVEPSSVAAGTSVNLILRNNSAGEIGYNLCSSGLERLTNGSWAVVPSDRVCTMELRMLTSGEEARYPLELQPQLEAGEYRFVTSVDGMEAAEQRVVRSEPFRVTG